MEYQYEILQKGSNNSRYLVQIIQFSLNLNFEVFRKKSVFEVKWQLFEVKWQFFEVNWQFLKINGRKDDRHQFELWKC